LQLKKINKKIEVLQLLTVIPRGLHDPEESDPKRVILRAEPEGSPP